MKIVSVAVLCALLAACGFKGDLYLPKEHDAQSFGVIQTGFGLDERPNRVQPTRESAPLPSY